MQSERAQIRLEISIPVTLPPHRHRAVGEIVASWSLEGIVRRCVIPLRLWYWVFPLLAALAGCALSR